MYECETDSKVGTWNRALRRIFRPRRDEVTGSWRGLRNEELHNLHCLPSMIRMLKSRMKTGRKETARDIKS
jgi:hypothetical protein